MLTSNRLLFTIVLANNGVTTVNITRVKDANHSQGILNVIKIFQTLKFNESSELSQYEC
jgi:hypothetical protein